MSEPFIGEVRIFAVSNNNIPRGWAPCNGQLLAINTNQALFALLGVTYGGDGRTTFALPNLQAAGVVGAGPGFALGQKAGEAAHTLTAAEIPTHTHQAEASTGGSTAQTSPQGGYWQTNAGKALYSTATPNITMAPGALDQTGQNTPHPNQQPYLTLNYFIALQGIFPSRN